MFNETITALRRHSAKSPPVLFRTPDHYTTARTSGPRALCTEAETDGPSFWVTEPVATALPCALPARPPHPAAPTSPAPGPLACISHLPRELSAPSSEAPTSARRPLRQGSSQSACAHALRPRATPALASPHPGRPSAFLAEFRGWSSGSSSRATIRDHRDGRSQVRRDPRLPVSPGISI